MPGLRRVSPLKRVASKKTVPPKKVTGVLALTSVRRCDIIEDSFSLVEYGIAV